MYNIGTLVRVLAGARNGWRNTFSPRVILQYVQALIGTWGGVVVKALRYKSMVPGIDPRWYH